jgi:hypothetical protein
MLQRWKNMPSDTKIIICNSSVISLNLNFVKTCKSKVKVSKVVPVLT